MGIDKATLLQAVAVIESGRLDHLLAIAGANVAPQHDVAPELLTAHPSTKKVPQLA